MNIKIISNEKKITLHFDEPILLSKAIRDSGVFMKFPCNCRGICNSCIVYATGELSEKTEKEIKLLGGETTKRLACSTTAVGDCTVLISDDEYISGDTCLNKFNGKIDEDCHGYGIVIDIGSTTVFSSKIEMKTGNAVETMLSMNHQSLFGTDVISRVDYELSHSDKSVHNVLKNQIDEILDHYGDYSKCVICGNTTEMYTYTDENLTPLSQYPFTITEKYGRFLDEKTYIPTCVSSFIGADTVCGILSSGILDVDKGIFLDLGTNGEFVYKNGDEFFCCSMAAGPVFEGAELECGGSAVDGAIVSVYNVGRSMFYSTVNNKKARSIAGSGVIDAIACFLRSDMIELDGYVEENLFIGDSDVYITPNDIRNIQMAKSAIYTSISLCCPSLENVDRFFIAGGFGSRLNIDNAIQIGMLPKEMKGKIKWCSNASADGARLILLDGSMQVKAGEIAKKCKTIYLNEDEKFKEMYIKNMNF